MPTNFLRRRSEAAAASEEKPQKARTRGKGQEAASRLIEVTIGRTAVRVELAAGSVSAERIWAALPLLSKAEPWGDTVHFEIPLKLGRERGARINGEVGEVYLWAEDGRILLPFGPTPISRDDEIRLPRPCNVLGRLVDAAEVLKSVRPGEKVTLKAAR